MKLKRLPEDFCVEELADFAGPSRGDFALYRLIKCGLGTPEALQAISQRWRLSSNQTCCGGLKDRHALTTQFVTIHRGPRRSLRQTNFHLEYVGQAPRPFTSQDVAGNRFAVVVRSLAPSQVGAAESALNAILRDGLPNYFDDQRFGSLGESGEFIARAWIAGDYERALWLAIADANPLDRARDRADKEVLRRHWGDWEQCTKRVRGSVRRDIARFLGSRSVDFRGALARIPHNLRSLYLASFQSFLWNRFLSALLTQSCGADQLVAVRLKIGRVPFFTELTDDLRLKLHATELPLPSSRIKLDQDPCRGLVERSLAELKLSLREIRVKYPRDSFFSKGWRPAMFSVTGLGHEIAPDDLYPKRQKMTLRFDLPRGSYATILFKRIAIAVGASPAQADIEESEFREEESAAYN